MWKRSVYLKKTLLNVYKSWNFVSARFTAKLKSVWKKLAKHKGKLLIAVLLLMLLLSGCASPSTPCVTSNVTRQMQLPPLPAEAMQTLSPDYSLRLTRWREKAAQELMELSE